MKKEPWPDGNKPLLTPPFSTLYPPGSQRKILLMTWRVENGYAPFHPNDYVYIVRRK